MGRTTTAKRITLLVWLVVFAIFGTAFAQQSGTVSTRIATLPPGLRAEVSVDGQTYIAPVTLSWPIGSRHTLHGYNQADSTGNTQWQFTAWTTNKGAPVSADPSTLILTADPNITEVDMQMAVAYRVRVVYFNCGPGFSDPDKPCPPNLSPGTVLVNGNAFTQS